ncbi:O-antigen/teichoic acid export membrane protein [Filimonas zeae]|uniref:Flippase n=1 Tax=Filimonas zeae TaxID=1737353 RepID=A0A917J5N9_9BACT|nr:flippase [Filimonas zeae]MDR6341843.1 O-antigen/teichoic acid export membrane protein [Filimonas zeae]GGH80120.1 hypothetical protein GCM10011379_50520 [Filimonas zeae]
MKEKNDSYWLKSGVLILIQNLSSVLFGFGGFYFMVRVLDKHSFGAWILFTSTTTIFEMIRSGLIQNALIKFLSFSEKEEHPAILSSSFLMNGLLTLLCMVVNMSLAGYLSRLWHSPELFSMFLASNLVYLFSGLLSQFHWIEQANFRFKGIFITNFIRQGLFFVYIAVSYFLRWPMNLLHMVFMQAVSAAVATGVEYLLIRKILTFPFKPKWEEMKRLFAYGKFAFGTSISSILSSTIDQMMLGALLSTAASASFNVAVRIMNLVDIPTNAIAMIVFPQSARRMATDGTEAIKYLYEKSVGVLLAILLPCLLILYVFPTQIVHIIAGDGYNDTIPIVKIIIFYCILVPFGRQFGTILDSIGKPKLTFLLVLFTAILNLSLNYLLIHKYGAIGAAYATLTSNLIAFIIAQTILKKLLNVNTLNTFRHAVAFYPEFYNKYVKPRLFKTPHG